MTHALALSLAALALAVPATAQAAPAGCTSTAGTIVAPGGKYVLGYVKVVRCERPARRFFCIERGNASGGSWRRASCVLTYEAGTFHNLRRRVSCPAPWGDGSPRRSYWRLTLDGAVVSWPERQDVRC